MDLVLLLLLLIFYDILLSYSLVLIRTITAADIPACRNRVSQNINSNRRSTRLIPHITKY